MPANTFFFVVQLNYVCCKPVKIHQRIQQLKRPLYFNFKLKCYPIWISKLLPETHWEIMRLTHVVWDFALTECLIEALAQCQVTLALSALQELLHLPGTRSGLLVRLGIASGSWSGGSGCRSLGSVTAATAEQASHRMAHCVTLTIIKNC